MQQSNSLLCSMQLDLEILRATKQYSLQRRTQDLNQASTIMHLAGLQPGTCSFPATAFTLYLSVALYKLVYFTSFSSISSIVPACFSSSQQTSPPSQFQHITLCDIFCCRFIPFFSIELSSGGLQEGSSLARKGKLVSQSSSHAA
jgi:hypothetical protein